MSKWVKKYLWIIIWIIIGLDLLAQALFLGHRVHYYAHALGFLVGVFAAFLANRRLMADFRNAYRLVLTFFEPSQYKRNVGWVLDVVDDLMPSIRKARCDVCVSNRNPSTAQDGLPLGHQGDAVGPTCSEYVAREWVGWVSLQKVGSEPRQCLLILLPQEVGKR